MKNFKRIVRSKNFTLIVILVVIVVFFHIASGKSYLTAINIRTMLNSMVIVALLSIGAGFLIISGHIDLSAGYVGTLSGMMIAHFIANLRWPWVPAFLVTMVIAMFIGAVNATLVNKLRFQSFIATLAMGTVSNGLALLVSGGQYINVPKDIAPEFISIGTSRLFGGLVPSSVLIAVIAMIIYWVILSKTRFGRKVFLVGGNPTAARLAGIKPQNVSYALFINNAALGCIAGCLVTSRVMSGQIAGTTAQNFSGITAAILGGVSFGGGSGSIGGIILGLLIISGFNNGLTIMRVGMQWTQIASGLLLILALTLDYFMSKGLNHRHARSAATNV